MTGAANQPNTERVEPFTVAGKGGLKIVGDRWGDPGGAPVILLHGGGQNRHAWKATAASLVGAGYHVISVDARGHGDSEWSSEGDYEMEDHAGDVLSLLDTLDRPPAVVGASMGGMAALWAQGLVEHQLFSSVILVDVTPRMEMSGVNRIVGFMTAHPDGFESLEAAADVIAAYNPHRERSNDVSGLRKVLIERDGRWHWRWDPRFMTSKAKLMTDDSEAAEARMAEMAEQLHESAGRLVVPTLLVRGAQSDLVSADSVREFLAVVPHASYVDVSGTGHMVAGDDNDAFTAAVLDFLHEHVPANADQNVEFEARKGAASAVRRFGHALVNHDAPLAVLEQVIGQLDAASTKLEVEPIRDRLAEMLASDRIRALMAGDAPTPASDGAEVDFARYSLVGGPANPLGVDATYVRDGEEVVALVTLGAAFEGPPGRAHGGLVSAVVDETMAAMLTQLGVVAFTASLSLDYRGPTPLHTPLEFRARLKERERRRLTIACSGQAAGETFIEATGTFVEVDLRHLIGEMDQLIGD